MKWTRVGKYIWTVQRAGFSIKTWRLQSRIRVLDQKRGVRGWKKKKKKPNSQISSSREVDKERVEQVQKVNTIGTLGSRIRQTMKPKTSLLKLYRFSISFTASVQPAKISHKAWTVTLGFTFFLGRNHLHFNRTKIVCNSADFLQTNIYLYRAVK